MTQQLIVFWRDRRGAMRVILVTIVLITVGIGIWQQRQPKADTYFPTPQIYYVFGQLKYTDNTPAANALIVIGNNATTSDNNGNYNITLSKDDFWPSQTQIRPSLAVLLFDSNKRPLVVINQTDIAPTNIPLPTVFQPSGMATWGFDRTSTTNNDLWQSRRDFTVTLYQ